MEGEVQHVLCKKIPPPPPGNRKYTQTKKVDDVLQTTLNLAPEEVLGLCCALLSRNDITAAMLNSVKNFITPRANKLKASEHQRTDVSSAPRDSHDPEFSGLVKDAGQVKILSNPHHKVTLIVRADLVIQGAALAFDCEKLVIHPNPGIKSTVNIAGDFALVDLQGRIVVWCYIFRKNVCVFNTPQTGLDKVKIEGGVPVETLDLILRKILKNNILVGAAVNQDLKDIGLQLDELPGSSTSYDIQDFFTDAQNEKISLSQITEHFTGQCFQSGTHSSLADARMTALAYKKMLKFKDEGYEKFSCPEFDEYREEMKFRKKVNKLSGKFKKRWEKCNCFSVTPKFQKGANWADPSKCPGF